MLSTFHPGELLVQRRAGTRGVADELSPALRTTLPEGGALNPLLDKLRLLSLSSISPPDSENASHSVWVSVVFGDHFVKSPSPDKITVALDGLSPNDVLHENLAKSEGDRPVGILALDFLKRRRYRTNGVVSSWPSEKNEGKAVLDVSVREAFPNCPKYIQIRDVSPSTSSLQPIPVDTSFESDVAMSDADKALIKAADTLFFGTYYKTGADVNHRGGRPGFVRVVSDMEIFWPDYRGNGMFQSFGNLQVDERAGVTFVDFATGHIVQLSGSASIEWNVDTALGVEPAAMRLVRFRADAVRRSTGPATNYRWQDPEYSPYNPMLPHESGGDESGDGDYPMPVSLVKIKEESPIVKTFRFLAPKRIPFLPGQYATFDFGVMPQLGTGSEPVVRTWTLSEVANSTKGDVTLEVSVKRKPGGVMSNWLHDQAKMGLRVMLLGVDGEMTPFDKESLPEKMLFISGGIGITPNMAILRGIGARSDPQKTSQPDVVFIHQERYEDHIPFKTELRRRATVSNGRTRLIVFISGDPKTSTLRDDKTDTGGAKTLSGRVTEELLRKNVPDITGRLVYLCGPIAFMEGVKTMLTSLSVPSDMIVTEQFNF